MTTRVAITFDIEFDINGAFAHPARYSPRGTDGLLGVCDGASGGLSFILDTLDAYGLRATFFIETLQTLWFGLDEMGTVALTLLDRGHELQLHLHPVWLLFEDPDWAMKAQESPPHAETHDNLAQYSNDKAADILLRARNIFKDWALDLPTAVRTGSLMTERDLYPVFRDCGLTLSSSVGLGLHQPQDQALKRFHSAALIDGVLELPVTSYQSYNHMLRPKTRLATVIGTGRMEQRSLLSKASQNEIPFLIMLSHISEFQVRKGRGLHRNRHTERKFKQLCFELAHRNDLRSATISELADLPLPENETPIQLSRCQSVGRHAESFLQKLSWK